MSEFTQYRRSMIAELRPYIPGENLYLVSISAPDLEAGSPKLGDMIARNPKNHADQWLVAAQYFADNFEPEKLRAEAREQVAAWMIQHSIATGHGDTLEDLLGELSAHIIRMEDRLKAEAYVKAFGEWERRVGDLAGHSEYMSWPRVQTIENFVTKAAQHYHRLQSEVDRLTAENRALRTRYEGKPTEPGGKGFCRGACEYRELTTENRAMREACANLEKRLADEREACAKVCDGLRSESSDSAWNDALKEAAYDIRALAERKPRFSQTSCSQCGREFGPGDHGYSHCDSHKGLESR